MHDYDKLRIEHLEDLFENPVAETINPVIFQPRLFSFFANDRSVFSLTFSQGRCPSFHIIMWTHILWHPIVHLSHLTMLIICLFLGVGLRHSLQTNI